MASATFNDLPKIALELCLGGAGMMPGAVPNKMCRDHLMEVVQNPRMLAAHLKARHEAYGEASRMIKESLGINTTDRKQLIRGMRTALIVAVSHTHMDVAALLLKTGMDISDIEERKTRLLSVAVMNGALPLAEMLIFHGAEPVGSMDEAIAHAVSEDNDTVIDWILAHRLGYPLTLLEEGLRQLKMRYVWRALEVDVDTTDVGHHVVRDVAKTDRTDVMGLMFDIGVNVCWDACATAWLNPVMFKFLRDRGLGNDSGYDEIMFW